MSSLTEEQRRKIEENRLKALEKRAASIARATSSTSSNTATTSNNVYSKPSYQAQNVSNQGSALMNRVQSVPQQMPPSNPKPTFTGKPLSGICVMVSRDRFMVNVGYNQQLNDIFRSIQGHKYDFNSKKWTFPITQHAALLTAVAPLRPQIAIGPLPPFVMRAFRNVQPGTSRTIPSADLSTIDQTLVRALMPFQKEGVNFGISRNGRCLISDDMGLGKSIQALGIAHYYFREWPLLIVCPSSVRYAWRESIWKWLPSVNPGSIFVLETGKDDVETAKVLISSYDLLVKRSADFMHCGVVIMDESHHLKNFKTARTKAAIQIMNNAKRLMLLSGTPALSRPLELFTQISGINRNLFKYDEYGVRYCNGKKNHWGWDFSGSSNMEELQLLLEETIMIRRMKTQVLNQLPAKVRKVMILDPSLVRSKNNKSLAATAAAFNAHKSSKMSVERRGKLLEYYAETACAKLDAVRSYLVELLEKGNKFICFAHHKVMLDGICEELDKQKTSYIRIDGSTAPEDRQIAVDIFQTRSNVSAAILSITAANAGITLTAANLVIFAELYWNPGILVQAEDRAHRIGQADSVLVEYLVANGTADDVLWDTIKKKLDVLNQAGLSKDDFSDANATSLKQKGGSQSQPTIEDFFDHDSEQIEGDVEQEIHDWKNDPVLLDQLLDESFD